MERRDLPEELLSHGSVELGRGMVMGEASKKNPLRGLLQELEYTVCRSSDQLGSIAYGLIDGLGSYLANAALQLALLLCPTNPSSATRERPARHIPCSVPHRRGASADRSRRCRATRHPGGAARNRRVRRDGRTTCDWGTSAESCAHLQGRRRGNTPRSLGTGDFIVAICTLYTVTGCVSLCSSCL